MSTPPAEVCQNDDMQAAQGSDVPERHPWDALGLDNPSTSLAIVKIPQLICSHEVNTVLADRACHSRWVAPCHDLVAICASMLPGKLAGALSQMVRDYGAYMRPDVIRLRIEAVTGPACWKWHCDFTTLRLLCTFAGPGTQYRLDPKDDETIDAIPKDHFGLFKGRHFAPGHAAALHRSPPATDEWDVRLLVVIDTPNGHELETAHEACASSSHLFKRTILKGTRP